jgi:hypothetical protein
MSTPSFLSAFNAKAMSYEQVASSFVSSTKFSHLAGQWNSLLVGPRGSGKTTLLRMLSLEGMRAWPGDEANQFRKELNYTGIYVPADIAWGEMIAALGRTMSGPGFDLIAEAAFVTNVMIATISAMQVRVQPPISEIDRHHYRSVQLSQKTLESVTKEIASLWKLELRSASLLSLQNALAERLLHIGQQTTLLGRRREVADSEIVECMPYVGLPMIQCVNQAISSFDRAVGQNDAVWALLFDEFEVAPNHLQKMVLTALRAGTTKLLFKVALAPCGPHTLISLATPTPPTAKDDFRQVELWYPDKSEAESFCARVFASRAQREPNFAKLRPEQVFGKSAYAIVDEDGHASGSASYVHRSDQWAKEFAALKAKDASFAQFLFRKGISVDDLDASDYAPSGTLIRKISPIVAFRNAYRGSADGKKRGRKAFNSAYSGWSAIAAMSEGNPRWLIGLLTGIFAEVGDARSLPIGIPVQQRHANDTGWTFANVLRTAAIRQFDQIQTSMPIFELLSKIGSYFYDRLVVDEFQEDPPLSFIVDSEVDDDTENCLRIALNHGAIVCYQPADDIGGFGSLKGKRFRLSYLLSPCFKLPVRKSKPISLSKILNPKSVIKIDTEESVGGSQGRLF